MSPNHQHCYSTSRSPSPRPYRSRLSRSMSPRSRSTDHDRRGHHHEADQRLLRLHDFSPVPHARDEDQDSPQNTPEHHCRGCPEIVWWSSRLVSLCRSLTSAQWREASVSSLPKGYCQRQDCACSWWLGDPGRSLQELQVIPQTFWWAGLWCPDLGL